MSSSYCLFTRVYQEEGNEFREELVLSYTNPKDHQQFQGSGCNLQELIDRSQLNLPYLDPTTTITTISAPRTWADARFFDVPASTLALIQFRNSYPKKSI